MEKPKPPLEEKIEREQLETIRCSYCNKIIEGKPLISRETEAAYCNKTCFDMFTED